MDAGTLRHVEDVYSRPIICDSGGGLWLAGIGGSIGYSRGSPYLFVERTNGPDDHLFRRLSVLQ
jgi:hypothetical protein